METLFYDVMESPLGKILIAVTGREHRLFLLHFPFKVAPETALGRCLGREFSFAMAPSKTATAQAKKQLRLYFSGKLRTFDLPLDLRGTPFQLRVWRELCRIPYGETVSYGELARRIGSPKASRAVGMANNKNRIGIVVPCHRVIGADGDLTGYAGGLQLKEMLLKHEGALRSSLPKTVDGERGAAEHGKQ
ncbi:MAG: methylated-DNA--[protein]-cysteine S-methyltransferase [Deltaproteobacteria bacterium]|nr:methylated-DNA--[protein]-cysteine S-methyltransferase [Deltaproteobacteria bacterium]